MKRLELDVDQYCVGQISFGKMSIDQMTVGQIHFKFSRQAFGQLTFGRQSVLLTRQ